MRKLSWFTMLLLFAPALWCQTWVKVDLDDWVSVQLPQDHLVIDTVGGTFLEAKTDGCHMVASAVPIDEHAGHQPPTQTESELRDRYEDLTQQLRETGMKVFAHSIDPHRGILFLKMDIRPMGPNGLVRQEMWQLIMGNDSYSFVCNIDEASIQNPKYLQEKERFYSSITFAPTVSSADQYLGSSTTSSVRDSAVNPETDNGQDAEKPDDSNHFWRYAGIAVIAGMAILLIAKALKRRQNKV